MVISSRGFVEGGHLADLRRWSTMDLPVFRVADWDGTWFLGGGARLGWVASNGSSGLFGTRSQDVWHRRPGIRDDAITVQSSRPQADGARYMQFGNMAIQILKDREAKDRSVERVRQLELQLRAGEFPSTTTTFSIDGEPLEFEVFVVGSVWLACAYLDDLDIEILGHDVPYEDLRLIRITAPPSPTGL